MGKSFFKGVRERCCNDLGRTTSFLGGEKGLEHLGSAANGKKSKIYSRGGFKKVWISDPRKGQKLVNVVRNQVRDWGGEGGGIGSGTKRRVLGEKWSRKGFFWSVCWVKGEEGARKGIGPDHSTTSKRIVVVPRDKHKKNGGSGRRREEGRNLRGGCGLQKEGVSGQRGN